MNYICKNCGKFITEDEYKKDQDTTSTALGCGCLIWLIILLCCVSIILLPIAIILILKEFNKTPDSTCPYCNAKDSLIPENTPMAQKIISESYSPEEQKNIKQLQEEQAIAREENARRDEELQKKNNNLGLNALIVIIILYFLFSLLK